MLRSVTESAVRLEICKNRKRQGDPVGLFTTTKPWVLLLIRLEKL